MPRPFGEVEDEIGRILEERLRETLGHRRVNSDRVPERPEHVARWPFTVTGESNSSCRSSGASAGGGPSGLRVHAMPIRMSDLWYCRNAFEKVMADQAEGGNCDFLYEVPGRVRVDDRGDDGDRTRQRGKNSSSRCPDCPACDKQHDRDHDCRVPSRLTRR